MARCGDKIDVAVLFMSRDGMYVVERFMLFDLTTFFLVINGRGEGGRSSAIAEDAPTWPLTSSEIYLVNKTFAFYSGNAGAG